MRSLSTFQKIKGNNNNNNNTVSWNFSTCLKRTLIFSRNCFLTTAASWSFPVTQYGFPVLLRPSRNGVFGYQAFHVENTSPAKQSRVEENKASAWGWAAPPRKEHHGTESRGAGSSFPHRCHQGAASLVVPAASQGRRGTEIFHVNFLIFEQC